MGSDSQGDGAEGRAPEPHRVAVPVLWFGLLAAPAAFLLDLAASFALVDWACRHDGHALLWAITGGALLLAGAGGWRAWRSWRTIGLDPHPAGEGVERSSPRSTGHALSHALRTDAPRAEGRQRFMALGGMAVSGFFLLVIAASVIPALLVAPCS